MPTYQNGLLAYHVNPMGTAISNIGSSILPLLEKDTEGISCSISGEEIAADPFGILLERQYISLFDKQYNILV